MKKLTKVTTGMILWLIGMVFIYLALRQLTEGAEFFVWLGHLGQGVLAVLIGVALIPGTSVQEFVHRTFNLK